jgi:hypothetical protein
MPDHHPNVRRLSEKKTNTLLTAPQVGCTISATHQKRNDGGGHVFHDRQRERRSDL